MRTWRLRCWIPYAGWAHCYGSWPVGGTGYIGYQRARHSAMCVRYVLYERSIGDDTLGIRAWAGRGRAEVEGRARRRRRRGRGLWGQTTGAPTGATRNRAGTTAGIDPTLAVHSLSLSPLSWPRVNLSLSIGNLLGRTVPGNTQTTRIYSQPTSTRQPRSASTPPFETALQGPCRTAPVPPFAPSTVHHPRGLLSIVHSKHELNRERPVLIITVFLRAFSAPCPSARPIASDAREGGQLARPLTRRVHRHHA